MDMRFLLPLLLLAVQLYAQCEPGWTFFAATKQCYLYRNEPNNRGFFNDKRQACQRLGGDLASGATAVERKFLKDFAYTTQTYNSYADYLLLGMFKQALPGNNSGYWWKTIYPSIETIEFLWCKGEPTGPTTELCMVLGEKAIVNENINFDGLPSVPCLFDIPCNGYGGRFQPGFGRYVCKKPISCHNGSEAGSDGFCHCKAGYFDIKDAHVPEGKNLKEGEMCIPTTPCKIRSWTDSLSIIFVVDSSQSIGAQNWKDMVRFLQSGSKLLDNSIRVGFVKFSSNVTYSSWLPRRWSKDDYLDYVPTDFDAGSTNTPAALDEAGKLFSTDSAAHKVAILITDGMPYVAGGVLPKEEAMPKTAAAAKRLYDAKVDLVALGYGKELQTYQKYLKEILQMPKRDYFEFDKEASDLKDIHMTILLNKVCERWNGTTGFKMAFYSVLKFLKPVQ